MGFLFLLHDPLHPPCAMRSPQYPLSPLSRAEQSLKAGKSYLRSMRILKRFKGFAGFLFFVNIAFHKTFRRFLFLCAAPTPLNPLNL